MEQKKDGWKNFLIFILVLIVVGLVSLVLYTIKFNKTRYQDDEVTTTKAFEQRTSEIILNNNKHVIRIAEEKEGFLNVYFDDNAIKTVINGSIDNMRNSIDSFKGLDGIDYLLINFPMDNIDKPMILNDNGTIIYEFNEFKYYSDYNYFTDDNGNKNFYIADSSVIFFSELSAENQTIYTTNEYATLGIITVNNDEVSIEYPRIEHGSLS